MTTLTLMPLLRGHHTVMSLALIPSLIGESEAMRALRARIAKLAPSPLSVLIQGPTGTGKELVAQAIHQASGRSGRFVSFNVSSIPEAMFADAIFGHVQGAFTNAIRATPGYALEAHKGTLFMDEVSQLVTANQTTLLRVLETHAFRPVGGKEDCRSDFRVLSASNENLAHLVQRGQFRQDLLYRLRMAVITVPALSERRTDIPQLARHFAAQLHSYAAPVELTACALHWMQGYDWPGNVRQLKHVVEAAVCLADSSRLDRTGILQVIADETEAAWESSRAGVGRTELLTVLAAHHGNVREVAAHFGRTVGTVYRWLREQGIPTWERRRAGPTGVARTGARRPTNPFPLSGG